MVEYVVAFMVSYFGSKLMLPGSALIPILISGTAIYTIHKVTADKPEGAAFRIWYRFASLGHFFPNPKKVKRFEI
jgi:hypothetical protein